MVTALLIVVAVFGAGVGAGIIFGLLLARWFDVE